MILIQTHHKTGTVWMYRVFWEIARALNLRFCYLPNGFAFNSDIYQASEKHLPDDLISRNFRGLHLIRDPRDVILSGLHYHRKATEAWLKSPNPDFDGASYQDKLNTVGRDEQIYLEMTHVAVWTTRKMLSWNYDDHRFFEARYEDLVEDQNGTVSADILSFLGFAGDTLELGTRIFEKHSLSATNYTRSSDQHVRSGRPRQWQSEFSRRDGERFLTVMGDCLIRMGYEQDDRWVDTLAP